MTVRSSSTESSRRRGLITLEALLAMIPLMVLITMAITAWRIRVAEARIIQQAHHEVFDKMTSGVSSFIPAVRWGKGIEPPEMELEGSFIEQYPIDDFPNNVVYGVAREGNLLQGIFGNGFHREAAGIRPPWIYVRTLPLDGIQNFRESPPIRQWFKDVIEDSLEQTDREFHVDRSDL